MDAAPQAFQAFHAVLGQPGLELAVGADLFLQGLEGLDAGRQIGQAGRFVIDHLLAMAAVFIELRHLGLQFFQAGMGLFSGSLSHSQLLLQLCQALLVWRRQGIAVGLQTLAALAQLSALLFDAALLCCQHLDLLLHLAHAGALFVGLLLRLAQGFFQVGQGHGLVFDLGRQRHVLVFGRGGLLGELFKLDRGLFAALLPLRGLLLQLHQALLGTLAAFDHEADFGFELAHLGAGFVELALGLIDVIACGVVRLADGLQLGLHMAQVGHARFQRIDRLVHFGLEFALVALGLSPLEEPQLVLLERALGL